MTPDTPADGALAQCCMCGKTGLSTAEDGGPECELHDGRWVCSSECWDIAVSIIDRLIPRPADGEALPEAIAELRRAKAEDSVTIDTHDALDLVLNAVLSGALIPRPAEPAQIAQVPNFNLGIGVLAGPGGIRIYRGMGEIATLTSDEAKQLSEHLNAIAAAQEGLE